jgi:hypothetical protein
MNCSPPEHPAILIGLFAEPVLLPFAFVPFAWLFNPLAVMIGRMLV